MGSLRRADSSPQENLFRRTLRAAALLGFPIGTAIGMLGLIAFGGGAPLFGPRCYRHSILASEWQHRKRHKIA